MQKLARNAGLYFRKSITLALTFSLSGCLLTLPKKPQTSLCTFDNSSKDDKSYKQPNFKCFNDKKTRYTIYWNSPSADKMVAMPYKDYIELNAYYKKIFDIMEKEFLNKARQ